MFDYWTASCDNDVIIGVRENGEKLLVKSADEYTSPIAKIYKVEICLAGGASGKT